MFKKIETFYNLVYDFFHNPMNTLKNVYPVIIECIVI